MPDLQLSNLITLIGTTQEEHLKISMDIALFYRMEAGQINMIFIGAQKRMKLKILFALIFIFITPVSYAELFKCTNTQGKIAFQDKPCKAADKSDAVTVKKTKWTLHLEGAKPQGVRIQKISGDEDDATIYFTFKENF